MGACIVLLEVVAEHTSIKWAFKYTRHTSCYKANLPPDPYAYFEK